VSIGAFRVNGPNYVKRLQAPTVLRNQIFKALLGVNIKELNKG